MRIPQDDRSDIDTLIRAGLSGIGSGARGVVLFLATGVAYGALIGNLEQQFYEIPYIALCLWLLTGVVIFRACDRGDL